MASASRDIKTRVTIEGDKAYRNALKEMTSDLKATESALKLAQAKFDANKTSEEALTAVNEALKNSIEGYEKKLETLNSALQNAQSAQQKYKTSTEETRGKLEDVKAQLSGLDSETQKSGEQWVAYSNRLKNSKTELAELGDTTEENIEEQIRLEEEISDLVTSMQQLNDKTGGTAEKTGKLMMEEKNLSSQLDKSNAGYQKAQTTINGYQTQINTAETSVVKLKTQLSENEKKLEEMGEASKRAGDSAEELAGDMDAAGDKSKDMSDSMRDTADSMQTLSSIIVTMGLKQAVDEITAAFEQCVEAASGFEYSMSTVAAVSGATSQELAALEQQALEYSTSTVHTAADLADGYATLARAGWDAEDMMEGMGGIMSLASASGEDLNNTVSTVTDSLTAFGYSASDASHFADVLAESAGDSNTTVSLMGESFKMVATTAGNLGYSIDDVAVALATMANNGLKGEMAGSALSTALTRMSGANATAAAEMENLNLSMYNADGTAKDLGAFLGELREAFQGFAEDEQAAQVAAYNLAGQRGMKGLMAIVNASDEDWEELTASIEGCTGAAEKMSNVQLDNYTGQTRLLQSAEEALRIEIGSQLNPAIGELEGVLTSAITALTKFLQNNETAVPLITGTAVAFGTLTTALTGYVAIKRIQNELEKTGAGNLASMLTPIGLVSVAIGTLTAASIAAYNAWQDMKDVQEACRAESDVAQESYEATAESVSKNNERVEELTAKLEELTGKQELNTAEQEEAKAVVNELNELVPGLGLAYDEVTNAINMNTESIIANAKAAGAQQEITELQEKLVALGREQLEADEDLEEEQEDLAQATRDYADAIREAADEANADRETVEELTKTYMEAEEGSQEQAEALQKLQSELGMTDSEFMEYMETIKDLNAAIEDEAEDVDHAKQYYDDLGVKINDTTAKINELTGVVEENTAIVEENGDAVAETTDETEDAADATEELTEEEQALADAEAEANETLKEIASSMLDAGGSAEELRKTYNDLKQEYDKLDGAGDEWRRNIIEQHLAILDFKATVAELEEALPNAVDGIEGIANALNAFDVDSSTFTGWFDETYDKLTNGFSELTAETEKGLDDWISTMNKNTEIQNTWNSNMETLINEMNSGSSKIVSEAMPAYQDAIQIMMDGGVETYGKAAEDLVAAIEAGDAETAWALVNSINSATDAAEEAATIKFAELNGITVQAAKDLINSEAAVIQEDGSVMIADAAACAAAGVSQSLEAETPEAEAAATSMVEAAGDAFLSSDTQMAWENGGKALGNYMINGINAKQDDVTTAATTVAKTAGTDAGNAQSTWESTGKKLDGGLIAGIMAFGTNVTGAAQTVANNAGTETQDSAYSSGWNVGLYFDQGFAQGVSDNHDIVYNAAYAVGQEAYSAAMAGTDAHSPSRLAAYVGEMFDAGLAKGINENTDMVDDAVYGMTDDMMTALSGLTEMPKMSIGESLADELAQADMLQDEHMWNIVVNSLQGQDEKEIVRRVITEINRLLKSTGVRT